MQQMRHGLLVAALLVLACSAPCTGTVIQMITVPKGCFTMGTPAVASNIFKDDQPHEICVDSFAIGKYEVTQGEWQEVMGDNPSYFKQCGSDCPVEQVSWNDVQLFVLRLNNRTSQKYRLPTEAEWEYAAKGGGNKGQIYAGTDERAELQEYAVYADNSSRQTAPVGHYKPNLLGIHDMSGNVSEWVNDYYATDYYAVSPHSNPAGPATGAFRVFRGGSYASGPIGVRTTDRSRQQPDFRYQGLGFRLVLSAVQRAAE